MCPVTVEELAALPLYARMRLVRKDLDLTQVEFAKRLGVSDRTVKGWEHPDQPRGAPEQKAADALQRLTGFPAGLFMTPRPLEMTIAEEISWKLDLVLARLGPAAQPIPAEEAEAAALRIEQRQAGDERSGRDGRRSGAGGP